MQTIKAYNTFWRTNRVHIKSLEKVLFILTSKRLEETIIEMYEFLSGSFLTLSIRYNPSYWFYRNGWRSILFYRPQIYNVFLSCTLFIAAMVIVISLIPVYLQNRSIFGRQNDSSMHHSVFLCQLRSLSFISSFIYSLLYYESDWCGWLYDNRWNWLGK